MRGRVVLYFAVTFLLGVLVGGGGLLLMRKHQHHRHRPNFSERIATHLERELSLRADQSQQARLIIDESFAKYHDIRENMRLQIKDLRENARERIEKVLTPEQRERFDQMVDKFEERRCRRRKKHKH